MSVYVIATYDIIGPKGYVPGVLPVLQKHGAEIVVADYQAEALEEQAPGVNVVLKFASELAARNWYNDADYGPVKKTRLNSTNNGALVLAGEFKVPSA